MPSVDMAALTPHVRAILADPSTVPTTGDATLDAALVRLAARRRAHHALAEAPALDFWHGDVPPHPAANAHTH